MQGQQSHCTVQVLLRRASGFWQAQTGSAGSSANSKPLVLGHFFFFLKLQEDNKIRIDTLSNILAHTHAFVYCVFDDNITLSRA